MDEDGNAALGGKREDRSEALVVQQELLRTGMELDPARSAIEAPDRLLDGLLTQIEAYERDEEALRPFRCGEGAVIGGPKAGMAVGLVHAERERTLEAVALEEGDEAVVRGRKPVDVPAHVDVRVEEGRLGRKQSGQLFVVRRNQGTGVGERLVHGL